MKVESIAECSLGVFCNTFDLQYAIIVLGKATFGLLFEWLYKTGFTENSYSDNFFKGFKCVKPQEIQWKSSLRMFAQPRPEVIRLVFILNSAEHEIYPAHKC